MVSKQITITLNQDLFPNVANFFVQQASKFQSDIKVVRHTATIDAKSIMGLLSLGISNGHVITIKAEGLDEKEAVEVLSSLLKNEISLS
ncbi:HPr family phosphocarrier protein [Bacillus sp. FJAT-45066]|uniref:HPr family phosphocarrier protein n=1 Tax=Bacillus sp. FJAT-45066 TaxID=2011010 RepID=UPI000BB953AB|nr:HPr family phosphocarrier protein [Bacillus sp. FJAT-45066]